MLKPVNGQVLQYAQKNFASGELDVTLTRAHYHLSVFEDSFRVTKSLRVTTPKLARGSINNDKVVVTEHSHYVIVELGELLLAIK